MTYYECKRCKYKTNRKNNMKIHLERENKCPRNIESYKFTDEEIYNLSLTIIKNDIKDKCNDLICSSCNKYFSRKDNLNNHIKKYCKFKCNKDINDIVTDKNTNSITDNSTNAITDNSTNTNNTNNSTNNNTDNSTNTNNSTNITTDNSTNNTYNVVNNYILQPFDGNWNIKHLEYDNKISLLTSCIKYTGLLEKILENDENLNVIIDSNSDNGLVYKNNVDKYVNMKKKDIYIETMKKINKQLSEIYDDIILNKNLCNSIFKSHLIDQKKESNEKLSDYNNKIDVKNTVDKYIKKIYEKKNEDSIRVSIKLMENENFLNY